MIRAAGLIVVDVVEVVAAPAANVDEVVVTADPLGIDAFEVVDVTVGSDVEGPDKTTLVELDGDALEGAETFGATVTPAGVDGETVLVVVALVATAPRAAPVKIGP